ncbi:hypothetical protein JHK82_048666 [Glycine max]|uniref:Uncharacterized protein n=1 Tax=Glycine max TaxID=3847 RepID=A0A0R0FQN2_SOYBN|nr:hypothetical protein JHK86_048517 [Glycine max]KAG4934307.1 hypothetical protein JHK87_048309 [Glycine soja]KAG4944518.1 hypothetical protein JHK85_049164 [Glycine max]KAG5098812.1 hypothetical protein JHK82_048666 [Glycine max]KAG5103582.1 hypothetical protein JHK84_048551 [Glycine max]
MQSRCRCVYRIYYSVPNGSPSSCLESLSFLYVIHLVVMYSPHTKLQQTKAQPELGRKELKITLCSALNFWKHAYPLLTRVQHYNCYGLLKAPNRKILFYNPILHDFLKYITLGTMYSWQ